MTPAEMLRRLDAAAEAAHDRWYNVGPGTSDMGLLFGTAEEKQEWREVVLAALAAYEEV